MRSRTGKKERRLFIPEAVRWISNPVFPAAVILSMVLFMADLFSEPLLSNMLLDGEPRTVAVFFQGFGGMIRYVGLCLCSLPAAGFYAEEYGGNAVYMRVQRMGGGRYAMSRILHVFSSAWLCAFLAVILNLLVLVAGFGHILLEEGDSLSFLPGDNNWLYLLKQGHVWSAYFVMAVIQGFQAAFYALLALAFSVIVPDRRAVFAIPLLGWYFNEHMLVHLEWLPSWLLPSMIYDESHVLVSVFSVGEWELFWIVAGYTVAAAVCVYLFLLFSLRRNGTFGGESE